jgi:hypothetical protein
VGVDTVTGEHVAFAISLSQAPALYERLDPESSSWSTSTTST